MTNLEKLKLELGNKEYFNDKEYESFLEDYNIKGNDKYELDNKIDILNACIDVLISISSNDDIMRKMRNEGDEQGEATKIIQNAIENLKEKIARVEDRKLDQQCEEKQSGIFNFWFTNYR